MSSSRVWILTAVALVVLVFNPTSERGRGMIQKHFGGLVAQAQMFSAHMEAAQAMLMRPGNLSQDDLQRVQEQLARSQDCARRARERMVILRDRNLQRASDQVLILRERQIQRAMEHYAQFAEKAQKVRVCNDQVRLVGPEQVELEIDQSKLR